MISKSAFRAGFAAAVTVGALAVVAPAIAFAEETPIGVQPKPLFCGSIATVYSNPGDGKVVWTIKEKGGSGAVALWFNSADGKSGIVPLSPAAGADEVVSGTATTGDGAVFSVVTGVYENAAGETCVLLPGADRAKVGDVPADPVLDGILRAMLAGSS